MASRGTAAFNTEDPHAWNSHARLLKASEAISDDVQLAAMFRVSVPTVRKWRSLPLGYQPGIHGRRRKGGPVLDVNTGQTSRADESAADAPVEKCSAKGEAA